MQKTVNLFFLTQIKDILGALRCPRQSTFAIEIDDSRAETRHAPLLDATFLAPASCFGCRARLNSFSFIWLNPPFDDSFAGQHSLSGDGAGRVQISDTQAALHKLPPFPSHTNSEVVALRATGTDPANCALYAPCTNLARSADTEWGRLDTVDSGDASKALVVSASQASGLITSESENEQLKLRGSSRIRTGDGGFAIHCRLAITI